MKQLKISLPSLPENIRIVESFIDNASDTYKFNDDLYGNIMVAVTESVNNAIMHGNKDDYKKNVSLELILENNILSFTVTDEGSGFDHEKLIDPTAPENLEKIGGRGIFLMNHLCDEVTFSNEGRKVTLEFNL